MSNINLSIENRVAYVTSILLSRIDTSNMSTKELLILYRKTYNEVKALDKEVYKELMTNQD